MTAVLEKSRTEAVAEEVETSSAASWLSRAGAYAIDVPFGLAVIASLALVALAADRYSWLWWVAIVAAAIVFLLIALNRTLAPALTGWTLGRALLGIAVTRRGTRPGPWWLLLRDVAHLVDSAALFVGWFWPLWDSRNRTFADLLTGTEVRRIDERPSDARRRVSAVLTAGVVVATCAAGLTYLTVYRQEQAIDTARDQIAAQGPRIVEQMLSYNAGTMKDDFARAQTLVTDGYRQQLVEQQQIAEKNAAASNEYWAVTSSVLSVSPDSAAMLIFLQGQRQAQQQDVKFVTATARVTFQKSASGSWQVSDLTVLPPPVLGRGAQ